MKMAKILCYKTTMNKDIIVFVTPKMGASVFFRSGNNWAHYTHTFMKEHFRDPSKEPSGHGTWKRILVRPKDESVFYGDLYEN